jgi:glycosyltransferase involved in cell wall biosynthesis
MDWLPNVDGMLYFVREILPIIRRTRPETTLSIVGRTPPPEIVELGKQDPRILVTGTVPDIRPHVWGSKLSVVPLRIGGGTRLKIYESMAARVPVVSTTIGAEGLEIHPAGDIRIADTPEAFANECLELLADDKTRQGIADAAWHLVSTRFSWDSVSRCFEQILEAGPSLR